MKQKATALTATTVAVTSLLPSINQVETRTVAAQQLPTQHIQHITGELLGHMGNTGHSFGQHHHFELHNGEWNFEETNAVNPLPYLVR
ncbi:hypothetical protein CN354_25575 [Bacillus cereus]|nr:hypothetical protein CN354_25575 [Bacillus cereus]